MKGSPSSPVHAFLLLLKGCVEGWIWCARNQSEEAKTCIIGPISLFWGRWLWHPVHAVCHKVFHPGRGSHHHGVTVSHVHWVDVIAGVYPRGPGSPIHGLRMVRWHLLHAELHEQLPLRLCGENAMVQQAVSHVFREPNHCQAKRCSTHKIGFHDVPTLLWPSLAQKGYCGCAEH